MLQTQEKAPGEKSLGELLGDLAREMSTLVQKEVQLAKTEITAKIGDAVRGSALLIVAGVCGFVAFEALVAAAILFVAQKFSAPVAALIVGGVLLLFAAMLGLVGFAIFKKSANPIPRQTVETLKEDVQWAKEQTK